MIPKPHCCLCVPFPHSYHNTTGRVNVNTESDTLRRLPNPLYEQTGTVAEQQTHHEDGEGQETGPTYEIIPLSSIADKRVKENGHITGELSTKQLALIGTIIKSQ